MSILRVLAICKYPFSKGGYVMHVYIVTDDERFIHAVFDTYSDAQTYCVDGNKSAQIIPYAFENMMITVVRSNRTTTYYVLKQEVNVSKGVM